MRGGDGQVATEGGVRNHVRAARVRLGLSQQELAARAGVTRQTVSAIEAGLFVPSTAVALRLARALGCRVEELFWLEEDAPEVEALAAAGVPEGRDLRLALARVGGRWVAHSLMGEASLRTELVPVDGWGERHPGAATVRARLVGDPEALAQTVVLAGCTPALSLWARAAERWHPGLRVHWVLANSTAALDMLARGEVHGAGMHLYDEASDDYNAPFVAARRLGRPVVLVNLGVWEEGLVVRPGLPCPVRSPADLARPGIRLVNREPGSGARQILERFLAQGGVPPAAVHGFDRVVHGHLEVAQEVAAGRADVGVSTEAVARLFGLEFVPLQRVRFDVAFFQDALDEPPVRQILATLSHRWVRSQLALLGGYDTRHTGEVVATVPAAE